MWVCGGGAGGGGGIINDSAFYPVNNGSGGGGGGVNKASGGTGGTGGTGGGSFFLNIWHSSIAGIISANGGTGGTGGSTYGGGGGGGSGGSIYINTSGLVGGTSYTISANGGSGGTGVLSINGGNGGGGRIAIYATSTSVFNQNVPSVTGGNSGTYIFYQKKRRGGFGSSLCLSRKSDNSTYSINDHNIYTYNSSGLIMAAGTILTMNGTYGGDGTGSYYYSRAIIPG